MTTLFSVTNWRGALNNAAKLCESLTADLFPWAADNQGKSEILISAKQQSLSTMSSGWGGIKPQVTFPSRWFFASWIKAKEVVRKSYASRAEEINNYLLLSIKLMSGTFNFFFFRDYLITLCSYFSSHCTTMSYIPPEMQAHSAVPTLNCKKEN